MRFGLFLRMDVCARPELWVDSLYIFALEPVYNLAGHCMAGQR